MIGKNKISLILGAFIISLLMVSSTTAVNISQSKVFEKQIISDEKFFDGEKNKKKEADSNCKLCSKENIIEALKNKLNLKDMEFSTLGGGSILFIIIWAIVCVLFPYPCCIHGCFLDYQRCVENGNPEAYCRSLQIQCENRCEELYP